MGYKKLRQVRVELPPEIEASFQHWLRELSRGKEAPIPMDWLRYALGDNADLVLADEVTWVGHPDIITRVTPFLRRKKRFPHTLITGAPGLGKTQLARWIAVQRKEPFEELLCPVEMRRIPPSGIVLLDEVHRQRNPEPLFPIMESDTVTILGATTRPQHLEPAFASRFFMELRLTRYDDESMFQLLSIILGSPADEEQANQYRVLAKAAAGNPRQLHQIAEVAVALGTTEPGQVLTTCRITPDGLTDLHLRYIQTLHRLGRPAGLTQLAVLLYADEHTIREHERLLIELGLVDLHPNGRILTRQGSRYAQRLENL